MDFPLDARSGAITSTHDTGQVITAGAAFLNVQGFVDAPREIQISSQMPHQVSGFIRHSQPIGENSHQPLPNVTLRQDAMTAPSGNGDRHVDSSALPLRDRSLHSSAQVPVSPSSPHVVDIQNSNSQDDTPPLASDSDTQSDTGDSDDEDYDSSSSMPVLQSVSDSSESELDASDSDDSAWDEPASQRQPLITPVTAAGAVRAGPSYIISPQRQAGLPSYTTRDIFESEDDDDDDDEDEDEDEDEPDVEDEDIFDLEDYLAHGGFLNNPPPLDIPFNRHLRSRDLLDLLLSPRRNAVDNDPVRAETLLEGLEVIPEELVRRYEKLRCGHGEDNDGCAICRDEFFLDYVMEPIEQKSSASDCAFFEALPFHMPPCQILAFPCPGRHLFHSDCLSPWLARKTTCPSCRFDIDPESLTLRIPGSSMLDFDGRPRAPFPKRWEPPRVSRLKEWLEQEELARRNGANCSKPVPVDQDDGADADDELDEREEVWADVERQALNSGQTSPPPDAFSDRHTPSFSQIPPLPPPLPHNLGQYPRHYAAMLTRDLREAGLEDVFTRASRRVRVSFGVQTPPSFMPREHPGSGPASAGAQADLD